MQRDDRRALQFHHVGLGRLSEVFIFIKGLMKGSLKQLDGDICPTTLCWRLLGAAIELLQVTHHWGSFSIQSILNSGRNRGNEIRWNKLHLHEANQLNSFKGQYGMTYSKLLTATQETNHVTHTALLLLASHVLQKHSKLRAPIPDVVESHHIVAQICEQIRDGVAQDCWTEMSDMHLLVAKSAAPITQYHPTIDYMYYIHLHTTNNPQHKSTQGLQDYRTPQQKTTFALGWSL